MSILCGTDFSENAKEAATVAAMVAARLNVRLDLLHAEIGANSEPEWQGLLDDEAARLRQLGAAVQKHAFDTGEAADALVGFAQRSGATMIVVSSLGRSKPGRWRLGSVAEAVAQTAAVPVLVIKASATLQAWLRGERRLHVVVGTDFSASSEAGWRWLVKLRQLGPCDIVLTHVYWPPDEHARFGINGPYELGETNREIETLLRRELTEHLGQLPGEGDVQLKVMAGWGKTAPYLRQVAEETKAELLLVGTHQRKGVSRLWHGSVSRELIGTTGMNVVHVPAAAQDQLPAPHSVTRVKTVLVATDLSSLANRAVNHAFSIVGDGGIVVLVYVIEQRHPPSALELATLPDRHVLSPYALARKEEVVPLLRELIPEDVQHAAVETEIEILEHHDVAAAICQAAERLDADIVCLGSHGRTGLFSALLGSVAEGVMARSRRPVLLVPSPRKG